MIALIVSTIIVAAVTWLCHTDNICVAATFFALFSSCCCCWFWAFSLLLLILLLLLLAAANCVWCICTLCILNDSNLVACCCSALLLFSQPFLKGWIESYLIALELNPVEASPDSSVFGRESLQLITWQHNQPGSSQASFKLLCTGHWTLSQTLSLLRHVLNISSMTAYWRFRISIGLQRLWCEKARSWQAASLMQASTGTSTQPGCLLWCNLVAA